METHERFELFLVAAPGALAYAWFVPKVVGLVDKKKCKNKNFCKKWFTSIKNKSKTQNVHIFLNLEDYN